MRRSKSTSYGERGGVGPTHGKTSTAYRVELPDGRVVSKRSFKLSCDEAVACIYQHEGKWYVAGVIEVGAAPYTEKTATAKREV